jgi:hypothetical protein
MTHIDGGGLTALPGCLSIDLTVLHIPSSRFTPRVANGE